MSIFSSPSRFNRQKDYAPWVSGLFLTALVLFVYSNSLHGPFHYDDFHDVLDNPTILHLWPLRRLVSSDDGGVLTRPIVNFSFALNYHFGRFSPFQFHVTNLLIHLGACLSLLGILRRTFALPSLAKPLREHRSTLALAIAAVWGTHPLLTEAVTYITQRYESLMSLFVLLTFYCLLRSLESPRPSFWNAMSVLSCLLALGSKEVAVGVPALVLVFDRTYMTGSFRASLRKRWPYYLGLLLALVCFATLQLEARRRSFAGFGIGTPWWRYALNQPSVILHYLRLALWPHPLNFDYFWKPAKSWMPLVPGWCAIGVMLLLSIWTFFKKPLISFPAISFFVLLAPTSSFMPILDLVVEHRMYLPLVHVVILVLILSYLALNRCLAINGTVSNLPRRMGLVLFAFVLATLCCLTYLRNVEYSSSIDLWRDAVLKSPDNPRAHHNYAYHLDQEGYTDEALKQYEIAVSLAPGTATFQSNYGILLGKVGHYPESLDHLRMALKLEPENYRHYINLGTTLLAKGSTNNAMTCYQEAIKVAPRNGAPYAAYATALFLQHEDQKAHDLIATAIRLDPENPQFHFQSGTILLALNDKAKAEREFQAAIKLDPAPELMTSEVGWIYHRYRMDYQAVGLLRQVVSKYPGQLQSLVRLSWILSTSPDPAARNGNEAFRIAAGILATQPRRLPKFLDLLGASLAEQNRFTEAQAACEEALAQSKDHQEPWVLEVERHLGLYKNHQAVRDLPAS